ncbi:hypothetical protein [Adlercreutzia muris]|uniref:hypothetical protein n=1 Tax=Adlercreutzia muris TaxID=1796610 RepID=UPI0013666B52|nr:hypothetical protein [Adlercreutzia muris]NCA31659.1 hypothetical protein [Adlercreutzia muris]
MKLSEKHPWLTWKNIHLTAVACVVAGVALIMLGGALAAVSASGWHDLVMQFAGPPLGFGDAMGAAPVAPEPPTPPTAL